EKFKTREYTHAASAVVRPGTIEEKSPPSPRRRRQAERYRGRQTVTKGYKTLRTARPGERPADPAAGTTVGERLHRQDDPAPVHAVRAVEHRLEGFRVPAEGVHALVVGLGARVRQPVAVPAAEVAAPRRQVQLADP